MKSIFVLAALLVIHLVLLIKSVFWNNFVLINNVFLAKLGILKLKIIVFQIIAYNLMKIQHVNSVNNPLFLLMDCVNKYVYNKIKMVIVCNV